jgi:hypothetical protein
MSERRKRESEQKLLRTRDLARTRESEMRTRSDAVAQAVAAMPSESPMQRKLRASTLLCCCDVVLMGVVSHRVVSHRVA